MVGKIFLISDDEDLEELTETPYVNEDLLQTLLERYPDLLAGELIDEMTARGVKVAAGDFAENITTEGIDLEELSVGSKLRVGPEAEIEITQFGKSCHGGCEILKLVGDCVMPREGLFGKVIKPGRIKPGDEIEVLS